MNRFVNKKFIPIIFGLIILYNPAKATDFSGEALIGYNGGFSLQANFVTGNFAQGFPMNLQFGLAYTSMDPGNALDARRIFINDATNGEPEKSGWMWDLRLDFQYRVKWLSLQKAYFYAGPRYAMFTGNFNFVGGNEDFDITSNQWGLGLGLKAYFAMSNKVDFVTSAGFDYYFASDLKGHDTLYNPDGEHINPRNDYTYETADDAINNPKLQFRLLVGINYHF